MSRRIVSVALLAALACLIGTVARAADAAARNSAFRWAAAAETPERIPYAGGLNMNCLASDPAACRAARAIVEMPPCAGAKDCEAYDAWLNLFEDSDLSVRARALEKMRSMRRGSVALAASPHSAAVVGLVKIEASDTEPSSAESRDGEVAPEDGRAVKAEPKRSN